MISEIDRASLYCSALDDIRARLSVVQKICLGEITFSTKQFDYEVVAINLRKVLEQIAFGSLTANHLAYEAFHKDIQKIWRAKQLLALHSFRLAGYPQLWLGELEGPDGKAHVSIASPV